MANYFINIDMGILPAGSTVIKNELGIENAKFGALGSMVYLGQCIGSLLAPAIFKIVSPKKVLSSCLALNIATLILFTKCNSYPVLVMCRIFTGVFQIFLYIFFPVWAGVYGSEIQLSKWLTFFMITTPVGIVTGYGLSGIFLNNIGWRYSFYVQSFFLIGCLIGVLIIPGKYMDFKWCSKEIERLK